MTSSLLILLQQQLQQLVQMNELLLSERNAFTQRDSAQMESINQQKVEALEKLKQTDDQISANFSTDDFNHPDIQDIKQKVDQALTEVKHENDVNGKIVSHSQVNLNMLKDMIVSNMRSGANSKKDSSAMTYTQAGAKSSLIKGRPIKA